jgi:hypothetical protein
VFGKNEFPAALAVDGDVTTSWFSAGPDADGSSTYTWQTPETHIITSLVIAGNGQDSDTGTRTGFGFEHVHIILLNGDKVVFESDADMPGTPDPDVGADPNVEATTIKLVFTGHEFPNCGGFSELSVFGN